MNTPVINRLAALLCGGLLMCVPAWALADNAEVEYDLDGDEYEVEVQTRSIEGDRERPDILIRRTTRIYDRRDGGQDVPMTDIYGYVGEPDRPIAPEPRRPVTRQLERPVSRGTDELWYGDSYTDDWLYSLKEFNLADDYRLLTQLRTQPAQRTDIFGYVEPEEDVVEMYEPPPGREPAAGPLRSVTGEIRELRLVGARGAPRIMAVVQTTDGIARRVMLGTENEARRLGLDLGMRITAIGRPDLFDGNPVLSASRLEVLPEPGAAQRQARGNWYHGTILNTRTVQRPSDARRVLLATVLMDDGSTVPVDLGPLEELPRVEIRPNDRITVVGHTEQVRGEPVVVADLLQLRTAMMPVGK